MNSKPRLLIIEDEAPILTGLVDVFLYHGYEVETASDGEMGLEKALTGKHDLILLDVMLPGRDGFSVCDEIRSRDRSRPIIMLTAKNSDEDIVEGLRLGADDYVSKPFSVHELVARVEAALRRADVVDGRKNELRVCANLLIDTRKLIGGWIDPQTGRTLNCDQISFTRREVDILRYLQHHCERPVPRGELLCEVWGYQRASTIETRTVDIHIAKLRRKIESDPKHPIYLVTVRGEGYQLVGGPS